MTENRFTFSVSCETLDELRVYLQAHKAVSALEDISQLLRGESKHIDYENQMRSEEIREKFWQIIKENGVEI
jgi:hypothetical protein